MKKLQKTLAFLLFAVTLLFTSSCSKDNDNSNKIIGRWIITDHNCYIYAGDGSLVTSWGSNSIYINDVGEIYEFCSNGSMLINNTLYGTYTIQDGAITVQRQNSSETGTMSIEKITSTTMTLTMEEGDYGYVLTDDYGCIIGEYHDGVYKETIEFEKLGS